MCLVCDAKELADFVKKCKDPEMLENIGKMFENIAKACYTKIDLTISKEDRKRQVLVHLEHSVEAAKILQTGVIFGSQTTH